MGIRIPCPVCGTKYLSIRSSCPNCDGIDFNNIKMVCIADSETTYRTETEEEFDIVATTFLSELDGWPHYETKTVEYEVPDGEIYTFLIFYENNDLETRQYHSSSRIAKILLNHLKRVEANINW